MEVDEYNNYILSTEELEKHIEIIAGKEKPWINWCTHLEEAWKCKSQKYLYFYLNSFYTIKAILAETRKKFLQNFEAFLEEGENLEGKAVILQGGTSDDWNLYCSDLTKTTFRQEEFFRYLFGVNEADLWAIFDLFKNQTILFLPTIPEAALSFVGPPKPAEWYKSHFGIDECFEFDIRNVQALLKDRGINKVYLLGYENTDSGKKYTPPDISDFGTFDVDTTALGSILAECRVVKTPLEIAYIKAGCLITCQGHVYVMRRMCLAMKELHGEALFRSFVCYLGGARHVAYDCICCSGQNGSILHYGHSGRPNDASLRNTDMLLFDMGGEYNGYSTDITVSFPVSGKMSEKQKTIYNAVFDAQEIVLKNMKEGTFWPDMHILAVNTILQHLINAKIILGSLEEANELKLGNLFMPHGLGHLMGLDTHDVGGYNKKCQEDISGNVRGLRTLRHLEAGMVITVEPGCYFVDYLLNKALEDPKQSKLLNKSEIEKFRTFGGVRLEDDVVVTKDGIINLTVLPRTVEDVEEVLANKIM